MTNWYIALGLGIIMLCTSLCLVFFTKKENKNK